MYQLKHYDCFFSSTYSKNKHSHIIFRAFCSLISTRIGGCLLLLVYIYSYLKIAFLFTCTYSSGVIIPFSRQNADSDGELLFHIWDLTANNHDCWNDNIKHRFQMTNICIRREVSLCLQLWSCPSSGTG